MVITFKNQNDKQGEATSSKKEGEENEDIDPNEHKDHACVRKALISALSKFTHLQASTIEN